MAREKSILVFGATGQQGGAVARALRAGGWEVRAFVRNRESEQAKHLVRLGMTLVQGDLTDPPSIARAMAGAQGVFSVQPSSGQGATYGVSDADEIRYGTSVADIAKASGVELLVYSSANIAGSGATGMGHFDSKASIEAHIRSIGVRHVIVRPSAFMEILMLPGLGLEKGVLNFAMQPEQSMQFIAIDDIGRIVATVFSNPEMYEYSALDIAGDEVTGTQIQDALSSAAGRSITYSRWPDALLDQNAFLKRLCELVDERRLSGQADLRKLRAEFPGLQSFQQWLAGAGQPLLERALVAERAEVALR